MEKDKLMELVDQLVNERKVVEEKKQKKETNLAISNLKKVLMLVDTALEYKEYFEKLGKEVILKIEAIDCRNEKTYFKIKLNEKRYSLDEHTDRGDILIALQSVKKYGVQGYREHVNKFVESSTWLFIHCKQINMEKEELVEILNDELSKAIIEYNEKTKQKKEEM